MLENKIQFNRVYFQESTIKQLAASYANNTVAQTYLFSGPSSCGRMLVARSFAALLQCEKPVASEKVGFDSCGECDSCRRVQADSHPDVQIITPQGFEIRIDQVRAMQDAAMLKPSMGKWQVFIIDPAEKLNVFSSNSLLKIFEEAPDHSVFILIAEGTTAVLPTILSRSRVVRFQSPTHEEARSILVDSYQMKPEVAAKCYSIAEGQFGHAVIMGADFELPAEISGLGAAQSAYLIELERFAIEKYDQFAAAGSIDRALHLLPSLESGESTALGYARKEFCRSLIMAAAKPAAFALMFSDMYFTRLSRSSKTIKSAFDSYVADAKKSYGSTILKDIESQINSALNNWEIYQTKKLFLCLTNWFADVQRWAASRDEKLLLNMDQKEAIITVAEIEGASLARSRGEMLQSSVRLLKRHVQAGLILENVIAQIGGPVA